MKKYRKRLSITQQMIANELGVTKQYISKIERGEDTPNIDLCYRIKKYFENSAFEKSNGTQCINLKIEDLFYETNDVDIMNI
ncbi:helix-turn-helix transcriptional regulator [Clostridium magnum]|uniref:helix-turn-helix transcriptional regulator n=1 Tax=Clostridium magnum TaxID=33954 RepID=UPI0009FA6300|nr:helix-turn-helix domain-containing protein [Clostridium magnum]